MLEQFTSDISFHKGTERLVGLRTEFIVGRMLMLTLLISVPTVAQVPCPPRIDGSSSEECGANQILQSDTPDYQDPLASCSALENRRVVPVATSAALQQALDSAGCGDTIELAAGTYSSTFSISKSCPATNPIIIRGAPNFQSTIRRSFAITGQHTIVTGINFSGPDTRTSLGGTNNKLLGNKFTDWRGLAVVPTTGKQGEIAYNEFYKPHPWLSSETGTPLRIGIRSNEKDAAGFHFDAWVHHNHFHDFPTKPDPGSYSSGQSDAIEVCQTNREWTYSNPAGWYIERNLVERHQQGHGIIDLKCGGVVVRHNTVIDSPGGRIDIRAGIGSTLESNWQEDGGSQVHGGNHRVIGNYMRGGSGINLMSGDHDWNYGASSSHNRAYNVLVAGNDTNALTVGKSFYAAMEAYPALDNIIEAHSGSTPTLKVEQNTTINAATNVSFSPPFKLMTSEVGPTAISQASAAYLQCRRP